jgi:hypothetical protein
MSKKLKLAALALITGLALDFPAIADELREITWDDLVPAEAQFDDPFTRLDEDTLFELSLVANVRDRIEAGRKVDDDMLASYDQRVKELEEKGVDVDGLIAMREEVAKDRIAKTYLTNKELDGSPVRMPGYLLPLEFDGDKVSEFLLVPWVGACIHTPPPPANQIVHVVLDEDNAFQGSGQFEPVWIEGEMLARGSTQNVYLTDGSSDIDIGYRMQANSVQRYTQ